MKSGDEHESNVIEMTVKPVRDHMTWITVRIPLLIEIPGVDLQALLVTRGSPLFMSELIRKANML